MTTSRTGRPESGFTMLELLVVIAVISILIAGLFAAVSKLRTRTNAGQTRNLLEKIHNGIENYNLHFRCYPPDSFAGRTQSLALHYFLTTAFRKEPPPVNPAKNEAAATMNVGPLMDFEEREMAEPSVAGSKTIVDTWNTPLRYELRLTDFKDPVTNTITKIPVPILYSCGPNKVDDTLAGTTPNDDITVGKQ